MNQSFIRHWHFRPTFFALLISLLAAASAHAQTTYVWNDSTTSWTTQSAWTPAGPADWFADPGLSNNLASFGSQATIVNQPNIDGNILVRGISIDDSQTVWSISQSAGSFNLGADGLTLTGGGDEVTTISASPFLALPQTWTIANATQADVTGAVSGSGNLTKAGEGNLNLSNTANTFSGAVTITGGTLIANSIGNGGANSSLGTSSSAASNLKFQGPGATLSYTGSGNSTDRLFSMSPDGAAIANNGTGALNFTSTGNLAYTGSGARTLTLDGNNTDLNTFAPPIANGPGGATSIQKSGAGTWILSGPATYTGATMVNGGLLILKGDRTAATGTVYVSQGEIQIAEGTKLGGDLVVNKTSFQATQGGTDAAHTNAPSVFGDAPEEIEVEGDTMFEDGAEVDLQLQGRQVETQYDRMDVDGNVSIIGTMLGLQAGNFSPTLGDAYFIINNKGANPITGQFTNAPEGSILTSNSLAFQITYFADADTGSITGGNDVALIAVPEPATNLLALSAAALLAAKFFRRKPRLLNPAP